MTFVDLDTDEIIRGGTDLTIEGNNITFTTEQLTVNRHYNDHVNATNIAGSVKSDVQISEHFLDSSQSLDHNYVSVDIIPSCRYT